jgi:hypothetical protein
MKGSDQFSDEEKDHLNYLGSMLYQEPTPEEEHMQKVLEWMEREKAKARNTSSPTAQSSS